MTNNKDHEGGGLTPDEIVDRAIERLRDDLAPIYAARTQPPASAHILGPKSSPPFKLELTDEPPPSEGLVTDAMLDQLQAKITELAIMELDADEENTLQINAFGNAVEKELRSLIAALQAQPASNGVVTDAMEDAGADAYHDAVEAAKAKRRKRNDEYEAAGRERIAPEEIIFPIDWLAPVFLAMRQAQPAADVEGLDAQIPKVAEAICVAMAAAQAASIPVGSDQWFHGLARAALSSDIIGGR